MLIVGILLLLIPAGLYAYFLMPFPGSQDMETMSAAYYLGNVLLPARILGLLLILGPIANTVINGRLWGRIGIAILCVVLVAFTYFTTSVVSAEVIFREPQTKTFVTAERNLVPLNSLVIGVEHNGVARAYPVNFIAYHHKVQDSVGELPVLVTYCTMCRTGRVYSPVIDGIHQQFRLVGARHYNAIIEDESTGSWWYQATGEAAIGPRKGSVLKDIPYEQLTLDTWIEKHPGTLVMQADPAFADVYADLKEYEFTQRVTKDSAGKISDWGPHSWVVGIDLGEAARAYAWRELRQKGIINDTLDGVPILLAVRSDTMSYHAWNRTVDGRALEFTADTAGRGLVDRSTGSLWNWSGECTEGVLKGKKLERIPAHQEYWRSWKQFHPESGRNMGSGDAGSPVSRGSDWSRGDATARR